MTLTIQVPTEVVEKAVESGLDVEQIAKEALLMELFRRKVIDHAMLRGALGLPVLEADELLKERRIPIGVGTREERIERGQPMREVLREISAMPIPDDQPSWETVKAAIAKRRAER